MPSWCGKSARRGVVLFEPWAGLSGSGSVLEPTPGGDCADKAALVSLGVARNGGAPSNHQRRRAGGWPWRPAGLQRIPDVTMAGRTRARSRLAHTAHALAR